jgi:hypothetical protein
VFVSGFVPLAVDHVIRVDIASNCDQPITTYTSLGKSINTTFNASTFGMFDNSSSTLIGVEVLNVHVIATSSEARNENKNPECDI